MLANQRKTNRWENFDYSNDRYYFVTICVEDRKEIFGIIKNKKMELNEYGEIVKRCWFDLPNYYFNCYLNEFVIMPNHVHGIIEINNFLHHVGTGLKPVPTRTNKLHSLSEIIRGLKTFSSRKINKLNKNLNFHWQRSFYDRVIRNDKELYNAQNYILANPANWAKDRNNLENLIR
ncbi:MAG TPA: transposase [bacterium]|nr:transposase [bacterium]HPL95674.1 transposase [bacterium]